MANGNGSQPDASNVQIGIRHIYLKDASLETPGTPDVFVGKVKLRQNSAAQASDSTGKAENNPMQLQVSSRANMLDEQNYEVILQVTVTLHDQSGKTALLIEVHQGGLFFIQGVSRQQLGPVLGSYCLHILFPYAREVVSNLIAKAGYPQVLLPPVNFDALYAQTMNAQSQADTTPDMENH